VTVAHLRNRLKVLPMHEAILTAIRARKPDLARAAVRRLLAGTQKTIDQGGKLKAAALESKSRQRKTPKIPAKS